LEGNRKNKGKEKKKRKGIKKYYKRKNFIPCIKNFLPLSMAA